MKTKPTRWSHRLLRRSDDCILSEECDRLHPGDCGMSPGLRGREFAFLCAAWRLDDFEPQPGDTEETLLQRIRDARKTNHHLMRAFVLHGKMSNDPGLRCRDEYKCNHTAADIVRQYEMKRAEGLHMEDPVWKIRFLEDDQVWRIRFTTMLERAWIFKI